MFLKETEKYLPRRWDPMDYENDAYTLIELDQYSDEYKEVIELFRIYSEVGPLFRIQNALLYIKFQMKKEQYKNSGSYQVLELFHDTAQINVPSIASYNIDWRFGDRFKYGPGVYFSTSSYKANARSNKDTGYYRAMFLFDVLVGKSQRARNGEYLPDFGCDTVFSPDRQTVVKYFDNEFYPKYVLYYKEM